MNPLLEGRNDVLVALHQQQQHHHWPCRWSTTVGGDLLFERVEDRFVLLVPMGDIVRVQVGIHHEVTLWRVTRPPLALTFEDGNVGEVFWQHLMGLACGGGGGGGSGGGGGDGGIATQRAADRMAHLCWECQRGLVTNEEFFGKLQQTQWMSRVADALRRAAYDDDDTGEECVRWLKRSLRDRTLRAVGKSLREVRRQRIVVYPTRLVALGSDARECERVFAACPLVPQLWIYWTGLMVLLNQFELEFDFNANALLEYIRKAVVVEEGEGEAEKDDEDGGDTTLPVDTNIWMFPPMWKSFHFISDDTFLAPICFQSSSSSRGLRIRAATATLGEKLVSLALSPRGDTPERTLLLLSPRSRDPPTPPPAAAVLLSPRSKGEPAPPSSVAGEKVASFQFSPRSSATGFRLRRPTSPRTVAVHVPPIKVQSDPVELPAAPAPRKTTGVSKLKEFLQGGGGGGGGGGGSGDAEESPSPPPPSDLHTRTTEQLKRMGDKSAELAMKRSLLERGEKLEDIAVETQQLEIKSRAFLDDIRAYRKKKGL